MRDCKRHPSESQPGGGVCASCLRERLTWLWRGESFRLDDQENSLATDAAVSEEVPPLGDDARSSASQPERVDSIASARKELQVNGVATGGVLPQILSGDVLKGDQINGEGLGDTVDGGARDGDAAPGDPIGPHQNSQKSKDVIVEWTEFHARRRRNLSLDLDSPCKAQSRSFDSLEFKPSINALMDTDNAPHVLVEPVRRRVSILMSAERIRSRSMPLDNRSAEETALRVIREQGDDLYLDELDFLEGLQGRDGDGGSLQNNTREQRCFSPSWHARKSPKWVKVLISPMTSRNKVFPSRSKEDVRRGRGSRKRLTRFASADWSHTDANGEAAPHWLESLRAREGMSGAIMRSSVFSWLQDAERTKLKKYNDQMGEPTSSSSSSAMNSERTDSWLSDLTTVGHLHEIAEELEEEDEVLVTDSLEDISSFGKFLLSAAQRQPKADPTRLSSAASS